MKYSFCATQVLMKVSKTLRGSSFHFLPACSKLLTKRLLCLSLCQKSSPRMGSAARVCSPTQHNLFGKGCEHVLRVAPPRTRPSVDPALTRFRGDPERARARDAPPLPPVRCTSSFVPFSPPARWSGRLIKVNRRHERNWKKIYVLCAKGAEACWRESDAPSALRKPVNAGLIDVVRARSSHQPTKFTSKGRTRKLARRGPVTLQFWQRNFLIKWQHWGRYVKMCFQRLYYKQNSTTKIILNILENDYLNLVFIETKSIKFYLK
jgi:hypothetical protein